MMIYIAVSGDYSDYGIDAVFTVKEAAEKYVELRNKQSRYANASIEEWEADTPLPSLWYSVSLRQPFSSEGKGDEPVIGDGTPSLSVEKPRTLVYKRNGFWVGSAYGRTPEKARKNLWDAIAKAKAEEAGL